MNTQLPSESPESSSSSFSSSSSICPPVPPANGAGLSEGQPLSLPLLGERAGVRGTAVDDPQPTPAHEDADAPLTKAEFHKLLNQQLSLIERHSTTAESPATNVAQVVADAATLPRRHVRNGKIARLPKPQRDMVCRMLRNNLPYPRIVDALDECGVTITERNLSNWRTRGGYKEWCAEQERVLQLSLVQDQLTDYLRTNEAGLLPEVGLQVAATQLSSNLLQPETARQLAADPKKYSAVVDMLCKLSERIEELQKRRNTLTSIYAKRNVDKENCQTKRDIAAVRHTYSSKCTGPNDDDIPHRNYLPDPQ